LIYYIAAFAAAFGISLVTTPFAKNISIKVGAVDLPRARGMHKKPMPRLGGIAIILGFVVTSVILMPMIEELRSRQFTGFLIGAAVIAAAGVIDDIRGLKPIEKLLFQIVAAVLVVLSDTRITMATWPFKEILIHFDIPITILWIIGITNAVNLIDGVDGLAAGVSSIAAITLMILCVLSGGSHLAVILTATLAGSCLGFLPRNFSPAEVIMGDTGALFLGYVLSVCSIIGVFKSYAVLAVVISIFCLALPVFDTLFAIMRRVYNHRPISEADKGHLHHRLIRAGYSQRGTVFILYSLSILCGIVAIVISINDIQVFAVTGVFLLVFILMMLSY
jgi:UDP-GlcNAc:undecaprenyl-phosphate GlcNAc-1-phosphate transferase